MASVYTYHNGPDRKVFMDGRLEVCSQTVFERFLEIRLIIVAGEPIFAELLRDKDGTLPAVMLDYPRIRVGRSRECCTCQVGGWSTRIRLQRLFSTTKLPTPAEPARRQP